MDKLLSIIVSSNRPAQLRGFFDNLNAHAADPDSFEVLVNIDDDDAAMLALLKEAQACYPFAIRYLQTPRLDGYYTLWIAYGKLLEMADPGSYFIWGVSDECRVATPGFDRVIAGFRGFYSDNVFRLKVSRLKYRNYYSYLECGPCPENFPIYTRKWMELTGGWGNSWGPDGWHQYIDYYAGKMDVFSGPRGLFRSIPLCELEITGDAAGEGLSPESAKKRTHRILQEWQRLYSLKSQENFCRLACHIGAYVWACEAAVEGPRIEEDAAHKQVLLKDGRGKLVKAFSWRLSPVYIYARNLWRIYGYVRTNNYPPLLAFVEPSEQPESPLLRQANRYARLFVLLLMRGMPSRSFLHALQQRPA